MQNQKVVIPPTGFLRLNQIIGCPRQDIPAIIPIGRSTWLKGVQDGRYPKPIKLSERCTAWKVSDITALISEMEGK